MSQTNYMRVLNKCKCTECQYEAYDIDFEKQDVKIIEQTEFTIKYGMDTKMICPECGSVDKFKYIEE